MDNQEIIKKYNELQLSFTLPPSLHPFQLETIGSLLSGKDVLLLTPTASGKTLPFVVTPLLLGLKNPITLVILPLDSLMTDMTKSFSLFGIQNVFTYKPNTFSATKFLSDTKLFTKPTFLLFSPEVFELKGSLDAIFKGITPSLIVVDEAHVVSTWGCPTDRNPPFRKSYSKLSRLRSFTQAPMLCTTATSTTAILKCVKDKCCLIEEKLKIISRSADRPNIYIQCVKGKKDYGKLDFLVTENRNRRPRKTLIFCDSFVEVISVYYYLWSSLEPQERFEIVNGVAYFRILMHTGSTDALTKETIGTDFALTGSCRILVSTISYGMGVNVADIRRVIIWGMPTDALSLWQEIGRAGRDMVRSLGIIYSFKTMVYNKRKSRFSLESDICYRRKILSFFHDYKESNLDTKEPCNQFCMDQCQCNCCTCCDICERLCSCSNGMNVFGY